jgi:cytochrome c oxidase cbb3-type subunit III
VIAASGQRVSGTLVRIDDFNVTLRDAAGEHRSWARGRDVRVELNDPLQSHIDLLDLYSDADIHNVVRYLESLK